jgi:hypothetical protein
MENKKNITDDCKMILDFLSCDYELFIGEKSGDLICNRYEALASKSKSEGFVPLIVTVSDILAESIDFVYEDNALKKTPKAVSLWRESVIERSERVNTTQFLSERFAEYSKLHKDYDLFGEFKDCEPRDYFSGFLKGDSLADEIIIAKIPTRNPWEVAAWIPMGGFNQCPEPHEQMAVFKQWYNDYNAVAGVVNYDTWELTLTNPPKTDDAAQALAKEQFAFCYDIVMQASPGWNHIRALASMLRNSSTWFFWWD